VGLERLAKTAENLLVFVLVFVAQDYERGRSQSVKL
jgi:hypothetical protein